MNRIYISIPYSVELTKEHAWESLDENKTSFFILRCHFQLNEWLPDEPHKVGEVMAVYQSPAGVGHQHVISSKFEKEITATDKSISKHLSESEQLQNFVVDMSTKLKLGSPFSLGSGIKSELTKKLKHSFSLTHEVLDSCLLRESIEFEITNTIDPSVTDPIVAVPVYKKYAYDIILAYVDYLRVDYRRSFLGLRKKSYKFPPVDNPNKHPNRIKFGIPISTVFFWKFLPKSSKYMIEGEHKVQVENPDQIILR